MWWCSRPLDETAESLQVGALTVAIGERATCFLDHHHHGGEVVGLPSRSRRSPDRWRLRRPACAARSRRSREPGTRCCCSATNLPVSPASSHPWANVTHTCASSRCATVDTRHRPPSANAPSPRAAHHRRCSAGADTTPTTGPCSTCVSAISVAHTGMPRTKFGRAVDRVDHPSPRRLGVADQTVLLAEQAVVGTMRRRPARRSLTRPRDRPR